MSTLNGTDRFGTAWSIFEIDRSSDRVLNERAPDGWLCFQRADGHLVRVPRGEYPRDWWTSPIASLLRLIDPDQHGITDLESVLSMEEQRARLEFVASECIDVMEDYLAKYGKISELHKLPIDAIQLRGCLAEYVDAARALGLPPEGAIKQLKEVIAKATRRNEEYRPFADACIAWAIESYYSHHAPSSSTQPDATM